MLTDDTKCLSQMYKMSFANVFLCVQRKMVVKNFFYIGTILFWLGIKTTLKIFYAY